MKNFIGLTNLVLVARALNTNYLLFGTDGNGEKIPENDARMRKLLKLCTDEEQEVIILLRKGRKQRSVRLFDCYFSPDFRSVYSKYVRGHHEAIVTEELWDLVEKRLKENAEKYSRKAAQGREEDVLAMIEEGMSQAEIVEYLGISISQVKYTASS